MAVEKPNLVIYGRVIALSKVQEIPSREAGKPAMKKQELYIDCTRYDSITGIRDERENKPVLEFGGDKLIEKIAALNLQRDDAVGIKFAVQGTPYKDEKTGKYKVFNAIRCYDIEVVRKAGAVQQSAAPQPQQSQQTSEQLFPNREQPTSVDGTDGLPF